MAKRTVSARGTAVTPEDSDLITAFLDAVRDYSPELVASRVRGISGPTIRRYREGQLPSRLTAETRRAMKRVARAAAEGSLAALMRTEEPAAAPATAAPAAQSAPPERDSIAREMFNCLEAASALVTSFKRRHGRQPTAVELQLGGLLFGELQLSCGTRELWRTQSAGEADNDGSESNG